MVQICPNCKHNNPQEIFISCFKCTSCSFLFVDEDERARQQKEFIFSEQFFESTFAKLIKKYPKNHHPKKNLYTRIADIIITQKTTNIKVIDIGASGGFFLYELEKKGISKTNLYAVEMSPNYIALTAQYFGYVTTQHNIEDITPSTHNTLFDVVTLFDVLEHVSNVPQALKTIHTILEKDGILYLKLPNGIFTELKVCLAKIFRQNKLIPKILYLEPGGHLNYWSIKNITYLEKYGFKIIKKNLVPPTREQFKIWFPIYLGLYFINKALSTEWYPEFEVLLQKNDSIQLS